MTTRNEALAALAPVDKAYSRFGGDLTELKERLADILLYNKHKTDAADEFRQVLWFRFSGGGVSATVTRKVFAALGREDECSDNWM